ncbi:MAG TPA: type I-C CRISPR-associated protein Cas8c/Csd1, partial [Clostridia bacterium]
RQQERKICIAIFDVATTGRMGLTFYQELFEGDYLKNIVKWHEETSYYINSWIKEKDSEGKEKNKLITYVGAPSFDDIMFAVYGNPRGNNDKTYQTLKKKIRKQLLECMFGNFPFPKNIVDAAARRASQPMSFTDTNNSFNIFVWQKAVNISCALIRKYYNQNIKNEEEYNMELEENRRDRDYLYGRLLAIADKLEQTALYRANKANERATNAVRLMNAFSLKPFQTWGILYHLLLPYRVQLNGAAFYQQKIDEVMALFKEGDLENNKPLSPLYLLGYSAQMRALTKNQDKEVE